MHDGFDLPDGPEVLLLGPDDDLIGRLLEDLLADEILPALRVVVVEVLGHQLVPELHVAGDRHIKLLRHDKFIRAECAIKTSNPHKQYNVCVAQLVRALVS